MGGQVEQSSSVRMNLWLDPEVSPSIASSTLRGVDGGSFAFSDVKYYKRTISLSHSFAIPSLIHFSQRILMRIISKCRRLLPLSGSLWAKRATGRLISWTHYQSVIDDLREQQRGVVEVEAKGVQGVVPLSKEWNSIIGQLFQLISGCLFSHQSHLMVVFRIDSK